MPKFTFDAQLTAAFTIDAPTREQAEQILTTTLNCANVNCGALPDGDPLLGEATLNEPERNLRLAMIDGEDFEPPLGEEIINCAIDHGAVFHQPRDCQSFWHVYDDNEEMWRVDASDRCRTKAQAALIYCQNEGCDDLDWPDDAFDQLEAQ